MPPQIGNPQQLELAPQAKVILAEMFPGYEQVILHDDLVSLGYSGSWVYRVHLLTGRDHPELPLVVKIAPADLIAREALAYQQCVRNQWPGIAELRGQPVYLPEANLGALCYPLMGGGVFKMKSLREYCLQASTEDVCFVLRERLFQIMQERILRPAYNAFEHPLRASYDRILPVNLVVEPGHTRQTQRTAPTLITPDTALGPSLQPGAPVCLDGFIITEVNLQQRSVTLNVPADRADNAFRLRIQPVDDPSAYRIDQVMPPTEGTVRKTRESGLHAELAAAFGDAFDPACATVTLPGAAGNRRTVLPNPLLALPRILDTRCHVKMNAIHGDLNLENVLVDPQVRDVRLIDFAEARHDHVLHDFLRLETEVATKILPAALSEAGLPPHAVHPFYERLHCATFQFDHSGTHHLFHAALEKPFAILSTIRRAARDGLYDREDVATYYQGLTVYLLGALKYANLGEIPGAKQVAFWAAATAQHLLQAESPCAKYIPAYDADVPCPYRSLLAFHEEHADTFFGREGLTRHLLDRLEAMLEAGEGYRLLAIVGPSGSGKSSLARAGLVAALRRGEIVGSRAWRIVHCRPGAHPLDSLTGVLQRASVLDRSEADELGRAMRDSERALHSALDRSFAERCLLLVDQFEEAFALCRDEALRRAFIDNLYYAAGVMGGQAIVVLALRADFYGHCADYALAGVLPTHQVLIAPMSDHELRRAIEQPAYLSGRMFEGGLVDRLLADVSGHAGGLPLLQYALTELWGRCRGQRLTHGAYEEIGSVAGALEERAEQLHGALSPDERAACRRILLRMVQPGEGTGDTCRRVPYVELAQPGGSDAEAEAVVQKLVAARLITSGSDQEGRFVQLAHEALLQGWGRLRAWVDENRESLRTHRRLAEATREWVESHRDASYLYWGTRLARLEQWLDTHAGDLSAQEHAFASACRAERDAQRRHRSEADSRRLAESALRCLDDDYALALLLAIEGGRAARTPAAYEALRAALLSGYSLRLVGHAGPVRHVAWDGGGTRVASAGADGTARIWHAEGNAGPVVLRGHTSQVWQVAWGPTGERVVTASDDGTARVWHAASGRQLALLSSHGTRVYYAAWSPDGMRIITAADDGTARVWDADTGTQLIALQAHGGGREWSDHAADRPSQPDRIIRAAWSSDGARVLASSADGTARVWDIESGTVLLALERGPTWHCGSSCAQWSPDETRIATAGGDLTAWVWSARDGSPLAVLAGHTGWVFLVSWSPDGTRVLTASVDGTARVWSLGSGQGGDDQGVGQLAVLTGHLVVRHAAWNPAGTRILTTGDDGTAREWDADSGAQLAVLSGHAAKVGHAAWNPAGTRVVTASDDGTARVWDLAGRERSAGAVSQMGAQELLKAACDRAERNMSSEEWRRYMRDRPYRDTCPGKPVPGRS